MSTPTTFSANTTNLTATVDYIISTVKHVISTYNGDASRVVISGFSRGAIGVNYLGLFNDAIASLWSASIAYTHYDGQPEDAQRPYPDPAPPASYQVPALLPACPLLSFAHVCNVHASAGPVSTRPPPPCWAPPTNP
jgi:hypothetical protein